MWKLVYQSVPGTSHVKDDRICQDSSLATRALTPDGEVLIAACSDGAGSAVFGEIGSNISCTRFIELAARGLENGLRVADIARPTFLEWYRAIHEALIERANALAVPVRELACTLLVALAGPTSTAFAQLGDGSIVVDRGETYHAVFWPDSGEYVNTTFFLSDPAFETHLMCDTQGPIAKLAMLTDGLQMVALNFAERRPHTPFFAPLFKALQDALSADELRVPLQSFLDSPGLNERTDDDKTLVLAARMANGDA